MEEKKCSYCVGGRIPEVKAVDTKVDYKGRKMPAFAFCCPACHKVISVELNPFMMKDELLREIKNLFPKNHFQ